MNSEFHSDRRSLTKDTGDPGEFGSRSRWRVLLLIKCLDYGGAERLLVDMAARADRKQFGYEAAYVLTKHNGLTGAMRATGTPVHDLGAEGDWDLRWMIAFRHLLVTRRYDLIHCHLPYAASLARLVVETLPKKSRPKIVYTEHSTWGEISAPVRLLNRATMGLDKALITVSESTRQALPRSLRQRAQVVIHGVDVSRSLEYHRDRERIRGEVHEEFQIPDDRVVVLTVANLRPEKGYDLLMEAARALLDRGMPVSFLSVGYGPLAGDLERIHDELRLGDNFRFLGARGDVLRLMAGSDVFTLASRHEGLPVTIMEATSSGLPIVATAVGEIPRLLTDGVDALIVTPGRADLLADALERTVSSRALREKLGGAALDRSSIFDVASAALQIEALYRQILGDVPC